MNRSEKSQRASHSRFSVPYSLFVRLAAAGRNRELGNRESVVRHAPGYNTTRGGKLVGGVSLVVIGFIVSTLGAVFTAVDTSAGPPLLITGLAAATGGGMLVWRNSDVQQAGTSTQWTPSDGVIYAAP
jgi:hypothetical protein